MISVSATIDSDQAEKIILNSEKSLALFAPQKSPKNPKKA